MIISENSITYKDTASFLDFFLGKTYYGMIILKIDNKHINSIFDFDFLTREQISRLKDFVKKHKSKLSISIIKRITEL